MKHTISKQQLVLFVSDEVSATEREKIERHLKRCASCRAEVADLRSMHAFLGAHTPAPDDRLLLQWRREVLRSIRGEVPRRSFADAVRDLLGFGEGSALRPALSLLAIACLAFLVGYSVAGDEPSGPERFAPIAYDPYGTQPESGNLRDAQVVNVDILSRDDATGEIEFEFEAMFRSHVKGNLSDPAIQGILAKALVSSQNPGVRLRAVNAFSDASPEYQLPQKTRDIIKASLISALRYDENQGVRLEALKALREFMPDTLATAAITYVLTHDPNAAMKIAAINSLDLTKYTNTRERDQLAEILKDRSLNDENNYIRIKAKAALQEVKP